MKYFPNKKGFLGIDNKFNFKEKVVIIPFGLEKTVSYGGGTKYGPKEIIKASHQVELYDEELNCEPYKKIGIKTLKPFKINKNIKKALKKMSDINEEILNNKLFPMTFGGEHSITPGCIVPFVKRYKNLCLLHFDAHADLRESYNGEKFSHASAIKRCLDHKNVSLISFGIRNISQGEIPFLKKMSSVNEEILNKKLFPITFGGEHSITPGCIAPFVKKHKEICLLHFDAHADLRESYNGEKFSHASAIRRCLDHKNVSIISFGIRNISQSEIPFLKKNSSRIDIFWAKDKSKWDLKKFKKMIKNKTVYLTFDVDGLDSSIMPATGTPEPGGLLWDETLNIIRIAAKNSNIVGADINELSPIKGFNSYNFLVAKLAYKILSYKFLY